MRFYDAHNHLQDARFGGRQSALIATCRAAGVTRMVVNGSAESDWPEVLKLAREYPALILPSFGYHPWYIAERSSQWERHLAQCLDAGRAAVGEIGLDRWKPGLAYEAQEEVFRAQLQMAADRDLPVSIHCLRAWGRLLELLKTGPRPSRGFLLHSFGGPKEMIEPLAGLGAYFSLPGYYAHERKERQRRSFLAVPGDRLLVETDAPDQLPPPGRNDYPLADGAGTVLNHPANIGQVYAFGAELFGETLAAFADRVEQNFLRLFGGARSSVPAATGELPRPHPLTGTLAPSRHGDSLKP